jgi:hypothetical protein
VAEFLAAPDLEVALHTAIVTVPFGLCSVELRAAAIRRPLRVEEIASSRGSASTSGAGLPGAWQPGNRVSGEASQAPRHEVAHITAHELAVRAPSGRHIGGVVGRDPVLCSDEHRIHEEPRVGPDEAPIVRHGINSLTQPARCRFVMPGAHCHVGHLVERQIQSGKGVRTGKQLDGLVVVGVVQILSSEKDARIEHPKGQGSGLVVLTSSAT